MIDRLKVEEIDKRFQTVAAAVQPVQQWAGALKDDLAPQLELVRALQNLAERFQPVVLVVEEAGDVSEACARHGLKTVMIVAPTTPDSRLPKIAKAATGFSIGV